MKMGNYSKPSEFKSPPAGSHIGICYRVIDLGTQEIEWKGEKKHQRKCLIMWELPATLMDDGKPFVTAKRYTISSDPKSNMRKDIESWQAKTFTDEQANNFDLRTLLSKSFMLSLVQGDKGTYVGGLSGLPKGMERNLPALINKPTFFSLDDFDLVVFNSLSKGIKETISKSPEFIAMSLGGSPVEAEHPLIDAYDDEISDPIPF